MGVAAERRIVEGAAQDAARRVEALIERHGPALLRVANQFSLCRDDALDAYQHALEIYLRRLDTVDPATEGAWMRVVVKHEAMAVRRARQGSVDRDEVDLDASLPSGGREVEDRVAGGERVERSVEALRALKPDEAKALMLKAEGLSYAEIGRRFGWTYTKVNRSITEGRARFMKAYRGIEAGDACERYADALAALADGTASGADVLELRPHLRHCAPCRAAVREMRLSRRRRVALLAPWALLRGLAHRFAGSDVATGVQAAAAGGGGRGAGLAALVSACVGGLGAASVCVVTGTVPASIPLAHHAPRAAHRVVHHRSHAAHHAVRPPVQPSAGARPAAVVAVAATPTPVPRRRTTTTPHRSVVRHKASAAQTEFGIDGAGAVAAGRGGGGASTAATATASSASAPASSSGGGGGGGPGAAAQEFGFQ